MYIYEYYNQNRELLYVGIAKNPVIRCEKHLSEDEWATEIEGAVVRGPYPSEAASFFEKYYIKTKQPRFNKINKLKDELFQPIIDPYTFVAFESVEEMKKFFSQKKDELNRVTYYLQAVQIKALHVIAYTLNSKMSELIRSMVDDYIDRISAEYGRDFRAEGEERLTK